MSKPKQNESGGIKYTNLHEAAKAFGGKGGKATTPSKQSASRQNGQLGGRPAHGGS